MDFIQKLKDEKVRSEKRLGNASKLLELLSGEGERWREEVQEINRLLDKVTGDVFLSVAQMSYLGPFTGRYRELISSKWMSQSEVRGITFSRNYSLVQTLGDPVEIRKWGIWGLPSDQVSIDNAIFTTKSQRWPMLIDPQFQGNSWLKKMFKDGEQAFAVSKIEKNGTKQAVTAFQLTLENAVRFGQVLLLEDMDEEIDPSIEQIVSKAVYLEDGARKIVLGARAVDYDPKFKLFLTTKLPNPHFLPEVSIKLAVINFTVTFDGLDDQLLAEVVLGLEPEVERMRDELIIEISATKNEQFAIQTSILSSLAESSSDTILDNEHLIQTLQHSRIKSGAIAESLKRSEEVEQTVQQKREQYRAVSVRGSVLYFVIASLASIDPMYQNSLSYVKKIFNDTIQAVVRDKQGLPASLTLEESRRSTDIQVQNEQQESLEASQMAPEKLADRTPPELGETAALLDELVDKITENLYVNICRGLFENHKLIFSFLICTSVRKNEGTVDECSYNLLLRGPGLYDKADQPDYRASPEIHDILSEQQWDLAYCIQQTVKTHFSTLISKIIANQE